MPTHPARRYHCELFEVLKEQEAPEALLFELWRCFATDEDEDEAMDDTGRWESCHSPDAFSPSVLQRLLDREGSDCLGGG